MSQQERAAQQLAAGAAEELATARAEREWLGTRRRELEEEAHQRVASSLKEGKDALEVIRLKFIADTNHFDAVHREAKADLSHHSRELVTRECEVHDCDISLDIREADVLKKEGALEDRLSFVTSYEEQASAREAALSSHASKLETGEGTSSTDALSSIR